MIRGTTPTFTLTVGTQEDHINLAEAQSVYVTITQGMEEIEISGENLSIDGNVVSCWLTQEDSMKLSGNNEAKIQVNWTYLSLDDTVRRAATIVQKITIQEQLLKRVIT